MLMVDKPVTLKLVEYIDFEGLRQHVSGYEALFLRLLQLLLEQAPLWLAELDQAFDCGDADLVRKLCHKIKGSAGTLQARYIIEAAAELSVHAASGDLSEAGESREQLVQAINGTMAFVRDSGHV